MRRTGTRSCHFLLHLAFHTFRRQKNGDVKRLPPLLIGQVPTDSWTIVTQTPDPTSVEFESEFRDLLGEALEEDSRKLLLVVDNLDRVQHSDALSIWSTLQTFLGQSEYANEDWLKRLWILIPYDANAIRQLWTLPTDKDDHVARERTESFLEKSFQVRFRVPPLLLSNWRGFLQKQLEDAMPDHDKTEFHDVYRAFATNIELEKSAPTPRDVKVFVNQIGGLHRTCDLRPTWHSELLLGSLATYVLLAKEGVDIHQVLLDPTELELPRQILKDRWRDDIAALHFGVPIREARQLLFRDSIEAALAAGDGGRLSEIAGVHFEGFWTVLEYSHPVGARTWQDCGATLLSKTATALSTSGVFTENISRDEAVTLRSAIADRAIQIRVWQPFDDANAEGMVNVGRLAINPEKTIPPLLVAASNAPVENEEEVIHAYDELGQDVVVSAKVWADSALALLQGLIDLGFRDQLAERINFPLSAEQWIEVALGMELDDDRTEALRFVDLEAAQEIGQLMHERVASGYTDEDLLNAIRTTLATNSKCALNDSVDQMISNLQDGGYNNSDQIVLMLKVIRLSKAADLLTDDQYIGLATGGWLLHHLYFAVASQDAEAVGECMFAFLRSVPEATESEQFGESASGYQNLHEILEDPEIVPGAVEHFTALAKEYREIASVLAMAKGRLPIPAFLLAVAKTLLISDDVSISTELVRNHWAVIQNVLRGNEDEWQDVESFIKGLREIDGLVDDIVSGAFLVAEGGLYLVLIRSDANTTFETWCANGLASVKEDAWLSSITSSGDLVLLAYELKKRRPSLTLGIDYSDALLKHVANIAQGTERSLSDETWRALFGLLNAEHQDLIPRRAYEILKSSNGEASEEFFELLGDTLSDRGLLIKDADFIDQVCRRIVVADNSAGIRWIAGIAETHPSLFTANDDSSAFVDLQGRILRRIEVAEEDGSTLPNLKRIASALGFSNNGD